MGFKSKKFNFTPEQIQQMQQDAINRDPEKRLQQERAQQMQARESMINRFKDNMPEMVRQKQNEAVAAIKGQVKEGVRNVNAGANARGLLYSGKRAQNIGALQGAAGMQAVQAKNDIATGAMNQYQNMALDLANARAGQDTQNAQTQAYVDALKQRQTQNQMQALAGVGQMAGYAIGGGFNKDTSNPNAGGGQTNSYQNAYNFSMGSNPYSNPNYQLKYK